MASLCSEHDKNNLLDVMLGSVNPIAQVPPDVRAALCFALQIAVKIFEASVVKGYARRIAESCMQLLHADEAARSNVAYLNALQTLLERSDVSLTLDAKTMADSLNRIFHTGKKSAGVRGEILSTWGKLCQRFQAVFSTVKNDRDTETRGAELRRICKFAVHTELAGNKTKRENTIVAGGLEGMRFACYSTPPLANSIDACDIFGLAIKAIEITPELSRFDPPMQALLLLRAHLILFSKPILEDPLKYYNMCRHLANLKHDKLIKPAVALGTAILDLVSKAIEHTHNTPITTKMEDVFGDDDDDNDQVDDEKMDVTYSQSQLDVEGLAGEFGSADIVSTTQPVVGGTSSSTDTTLTIERCTLILNQFMMSFRDAMSAPPVRKAEGDKEGRDRYKREVEFAVQGYGLFAGAILALKPAQEGPKLLNDILQALFKCSEAFDADDAKAAATLFVDAKINPVASRHGKLLCTYARILRKMPRTSLRQLNDPAVQNVINKLVNEVKYLHHEWVRAGLYIQPAIAFGISMLFCGSSFSLLRHLLASLIPDLVTRSVAHIPSTNVEPVLDRLIDPDTGQPTTRLVFSYIEFWRRIFQLDFAPPPSSAAAVVGLKSTATTTATIHVAPSQQLDRKTSIVYDALMKELLRGIERLNLAVMVSSVDGGGGGVSATTTTTTTTTNVGDEEVLVEGLQRGVPVTGPTQLLFAPSNITPVVPKDFVQFYEYTTLVCALFSTRRADAARWVDMLLRMCLQKLQEYPLASGFYRLALVGFKVLDEDETILDKDVGLEFIVRDLIESSLGKSTLYTDELLLSCLQCVLACPRGKLLNEFLVQRKYGGLIQATNEALALGLSSPLAANIAFDALYKWQLLNLMDEDGYRELGPMMLKHVRGGA